MTTIPENEVTQQDLIEWYNLANDLKSLRIRESLLRKKIFGIVFPEPTEGTNTAELDGGYVLKGKFPLTRTIDQGALDALKDGLRGQKINPDSVVQYKSSLVKREYDKLTAEQRQFFDQCLIIKPGSPALEIVMPAKNKNDI